MATQDYPIFEVDADIPGVGASTGIFELKKATVRPRIRTGLLVKDRFSDVLAYFGDLAGDDGGGRRGVNVDAGGGQHAIEVDVEIRSGDDGQWGYSSDTNTLDAGTASGGDRIQKAQVFNNYLVHSSPDSFAPATLRYGEYAPGGENEQGALDVIVEDPEFTIPRDKSTTAQFSATFISTVDIGERAVTALGRTD